MPGYFASSPRSNSHTANAVVKCLRWGDVAAGVFAASLMMFERKRVLMTRHLSIAEHPSSARPQIQQHPQIQSGSAQPLLEVRDLHKTYGTGNSEFHALRGVSLDINAGESLAIVGKSGSGKSTLMHLLALLDRPTKGSITLDGIETSKLSQKQLNRTRNEKFGFVFQQFFLTAQNTVLDNVTMPLAIAGVSAKERTARGLEVLRQLGIEDKAHNKANDLSGGQKQRVVIARALINRRFGYFCR